MKEKGMWDDVNVILIISDTLRRDFLGCYGNEWISTPNIDRFAESSIVFDNAYVGSFPTVPNRHEILTGKFVFTYHSWAPLPEKDVTLPKILGDEGYLTMGIFDTPHPYAPGMNYQRDFEEWVLIRGQENDAFITEPIEVKLPAKPEKLRSPYKTVVQYLKNVSIRKGEEDCFVAQTMREGGKWIEKNCGGGKFFLYMDTFDPHEPWDPPRYYVDLYDPNYDGEEVIYPRYGNPDVLTEKELNHCRALYAGEVTLLDRWFGHFLRKVEDTGILKNTAIIFTSDHGFYLGEHNLMGKSIIEGDFFSWAPLYEELVRIPLMIYFPGVEPRRMSSFVQPPDITATILKIAGAEIPDYIYGKSLIPLIEKKMDKIRDFVISSPPIIKGAPAGEKITVTSEDGWCLIYEGERGEGYNVEAVDSIKRHVEREIFGSQLYHLLDDPCQKMNLIKGNEEIAKRLHGKMIEFLKQMKTDEKVMGYWR